MQNISEQCDIFEFRINSSACNNSVDYMGLDILKEEPDLSGNSGIVNMGADNWESENVTGENSDVMQNISKQCDLFEFGINSNDGNKSVDHIGLPDLSGNSGIENMEADNLESENIIGENSDVIQNISEQCDLFESYEDSNSCFQSADYVGSDVLEEPNKGLKAKELKYQVANDLCSKMIKIL